VALARAIVEGQTARALAELGAVLDSGVTVGSAVEALGEVFRNMMIASACGADSDLIELSDQGRKEVAELAGKLSLPAVVQAVGILQALARNVRTSSLARPLVEAGVVRLAEAEKFIDPESLAQRLEELASSGAGGQKKNTDLIRPVRDQDRSVAATVPRPVPARASHRQHMGDSPGESAPNGAYVGGAVGEMPVRLSTAEKNAIDQDPAVRAVMAVFGGKVVERRVVRPADSGNQERTPTPDGEGDFGPNGPGEAQSQGSPTQSR